LDITSPDAFLSNDPFVCKAGITDVRVALFSGELDCELQFIQTTERILRIMTDIDLFPKIEEDATFNEPVKLINSDTSVAQFNVSVAFNRIMGFLLLLNDSVRGHTIDEPIKSSPTVQAIGEVLDVLNTWIDQVPPSTGPRRFGNVAFRQWVQRVEEVIMIRERLTPACSKTPAQSPS
jgi:hypothetical protein